jgi:hypothetical protein
MRTVIAARELRKQAKYIAWIESLHEVNRRKREREQREEERKELKRKAEQEKAQKLQEEAAKRTRAEMKRRRDQPIWGYDFKGL